MNQPRCINLDWLECYCLEPLDLALDAQYFKDHGFEVIQRDYGTRIYEEMFTILDPTFSYKYIEVRRKPKSADNSGGVLPFNACHIRLCNRTCYYDNAADIMQQFIQQHGYTFQRISRVDVALDFERFDSGDIPQKFLYRYMKGKLTKINQAAVHAHGNDTWERREWNSLSWGSPHSSIGTKFYNKTKELAEVSDKPYIRQAWFLAGLVDNPIDCTKLRADGTLYKPDIWRVEFAIKSDVKNWVVIEQDGNSKALRSIRNTLDMYTTKMQQLAIFASLQQHYFHFKKFIPGKTKYQCPDKQLFDFGTQEQTFKVEHTASDKKPDNKLLRLLRLLTEYKTTCIKPQLHQAVQLIIDTIQSANAGRLCQNTFSREQILALQQAIAARLAGAQQDPAEIINNIKQSIHNQTLF